MGLGLLFHSIWNEQNSGPITRPREPLRTGDGPTPQASLRGTTGQATPTRAAPWRPFPPQGLVPMPLPAALLGSGSFSLLRFQFISSDGPSVPLTYNPSFYSITGLWFWTATPPLVDPVLVKLSAKALWSPLVRELWTFCSCVVTAPGNFLPTSTPEETVYWGHKITLLPVPSLILSPFHSVL